MHGINPGKRKQLSIEFLIQTIFNMKEMDGKIYYANKIKRKLEKLY